MRKKCTPVGEYKCQIPLIINGKTHGIDYCISDIVAALNAANITTMCSCCGHGDESKALIMLKDGRNLRIENVKLGAW